MTLFLPYFYCVHFNFLTLKMGTNYGVTTLLRGGNTIIRLFFDFPYIVIDNINKKIPHSSSLTLLHGHPNFSIRANLLRSIFKLTTAGYCYTSYKGLKLKGIGYKFVVSSLNLKCYMFISAGLSHLTVYRLSRSTLVLRLKKKKRLLILYSTNKSNLANECRIVRNLSTPNIYSGKGLYFYHEKIILKQGKKQSR